MSLAQEALQSRGVSMLQTGTAIGATPEGGALLVVETTQRTTRVTERVSQPVEVVTKAAGTAQRAALTETPNNPSAGLLTLADGATRHTLYVDATAVGPHTPTHHAERWLRYAVTGLLSWSRHPAVPLKKKKISGSLICWCHIQLWTLSFEIVTWLWTINLGVSGALPKYCNLMHISP